MAAPGQEARPWRNSQSTGMPLDKDIRTSEGAEIANFSRNFAHHSGRRLQILRLPLTGVNPFSRIPHKEHATRPKYCTLLHFVAHANMQI
jgi:hypothetical protein